MVTVGWIAHQSIPGMPLSSAFVLGAIVSPTDPLSTLAIARRLKVPQRIQNLLEGESLVNDSTGLVCYRLALAAVVGGSFSYLQAVASVPANDRRGGLLLGLAVGWGWSRFNAASMIRPVEITISLLTPFAAYLPAERLGVSGVLAVVAAGLYVGWNSPLIHKAQTRLHAAPFWGMLQFLLNGLVFLLVGLELPDLVHGIHGASAATLAWQAALLSASVILIRILWTFAAAYPPRWLSRHLREQDPFPDWRNVALVAWTGTRGAVSLAAALALPHTTSSGAPFPARSSIQFLTYCVILATLVVQGLSLPKVIGWLKVTGGDEAAREESEARKRATQAVLGYLESQQGKNPKPHWTSCWPNMPSAWSNWNSRRMRAEAEASAPASAAYRRLQREALERERRTLLELRNQHLINDEVLRRIQHDIDLAEDRLRHQT